MIKEAEVEAQTRNKLVEIILKNEAMTRILLSNYVDGLTMKEVEVMTKRIKKLNRGG